MLLISNSIQVVDNLVAMTESVVCKKKYLLIFLSLFLFFPVYNNQLAAEVPSELVIGVPAIPEEVNLLSSNDAGIHIIRNMVTSPILVKNDDKSRGIFSLILADSFQVNSDLRRWSFRIRDSLIFSNGRSIRGVDVCGSLMACSKPMEGVVFSSCSVRAQGLEVADREWVDIEFNFQGEDRVPQTAIVDMLSICPMVENATRIIFGQDYGEGVNLVSSGEYRLTFFSPKRSYGLERFQRDRLGKPIVEQHIEVRSFSSMKDALAALRVGTIGMFVNNDPNIPAVIASDQTIHTRMCGQDQLVYRRGFQFECADGIRVSTVVWDLS